MPTVLSHIVETRLSQEYENVATDALAFVLTRNEAARQGLMNLLRVIIPRLPDLQFRTQRSVENAQPDMWGFDGGNPRMFVENKFWAGLTENQPVKYLQHLAEYEQPSLLLFVVPDARLETIWHELIGRLHKAGIHTEDQPMSDRGIRTVKTGDGRFMSLTSWDSVLSYIEYELEDGSSGQNDLNQLRSLCGAANAQAFTPFAAEFLSDQRIPGFIYQMEKLVADSVNLAVQEGVLSIEGLQPTKSWTALGRYAWLTAGSRYGIWFGLHFGLWRTYGGSPLWVSFSSTEFGRRLEVEPIMAPWCRRKHIYDVSESDDYSVAIEMPTGVEKDSVVRSIVDQLKAIYNALESAELESVAFKNE